MLQGRHCLPDLSLPEVNIVGLVPNSNSLQHKSFQVLVPRGPDQAGPERIHDGRGGGGQCPQEEELGGGRRTEL